MTPYEPGRMLLEALSLAAGLYGVVILFVTLRHCARAWQLGLDKRFPLKKREAHTEPARQTEIEPARKTRPIEAQRSKSNN